MNVTTRVLARLLGLPPARTRVTVDRDLRVPTPDGAVLLADRWHPATPDGDRAPILLARSPYGRGGVFGLLYRGIAERGYQVVAVSCRGTFGSGGDWLPFRNEQADGAAVLSWLPEQPWFVDNVATFGASYIGQTQWAIAADPPPWLKAMTPAITSSWFRDVVYPRDVFALESLLAWIHELEHQEGPLRTVLRARLEARRRIAAGARVVPVGDADAAAVGHHVDFFQEWLQHEEPDDPWWSSIDFGGAATTAPPTNLVAGWYDLFLPYQLDDFKRLRAAGRPVRLLVGPGSHTSPSTIGAFVRESVDWADIHLRGMPSRRRTDVRVYLLGAKRWVDLADWPPPSTATRYHLQARGGLDVAEPGTTPPDGFRFDPSDPTPSVGGATLAPGAGPKDNRKREARHDVLVYTTPPLTDDVTVIGEVSAELFVRSSLDHTDFFVRLCDVAPNGKSVNISDGILRVRPGTGERRPDGTLRLTVPMFATACVFRRGHRIRLQVSSGAHPLYARNTGSGEPLGKATTLLVAEQQVCHDPDHPSAVILPLASV